MKFVYFTHSLVSCWNHGNAHFVRGVLRELQNAGHDVRAYEPADGWSRANLVAAHGDAGLEAYRREYPGLRSLAYAAEDDLEALVDGGDVVIVHEWNDPALVAALGKLRRHGDFLLLFHDTHHRAVSDPDAMLRFDLSFYDGVLAFGGALAEVYRRWGWGTRVFVWHEAADERLFRPPLAEVEKRRGLVWIGNWGDEERSAELEEFLFAPALASGLPLRIHGVRYPDAALARLAHYGAEYHGWLPNAAVPRVFAQHTATIHVPRRFYAAQLPGIPTIRVFEALACGIPLLSAPWDDCEGLFTRDVDYLMAQDGESMGRHLFALRGDPALRDSLASHGLAAIRARHTCAHRVRELLAIIDTISGQSLEAVA